MKQIKPQENQVDNYLLKGLLEGGLGGVLLITENGKVHYANRLACKILSQSSHDDWQWERLIQGIWDLYQAVLDSQDEYPFAHESTLMIPHVGQIVLRGRWFRMEYPASSLVFLTLDHRYHLDHERAIANLTHYNLTPREMEVWLLRQANYSYKEIATELFITLNTVKKHMKNIYAKLKAHDSKQYRNVIRLDQRKIS
ncbi:MAG: helix-turn-helix transcriptional regulator [Elainellaceae cyanobacterium]